MNKSKEKNLRYPVKSLRLAEATWENLIHKRTKSGKSWNLFIVELLKKQNDKQGSNTTGN